MYAWKQLTVVDHLLLHLPFHRLIEDVFEEEPWKRNKNPKDVDGSSKQKRFLPDKCSINAVERRYAVRNQFLILFLGLTAIPHLL